MSGFVQYVSLMDVTPASIGVNVGARGNFATANLDRVVTMHPFAGSANGDLGQLIQMGERLARDARRAGHAHRAALRTRLLAVAVEECDKRADHRRDIAILRADLDRQAAS